MMQNVIARVMSHLTDPQWGLPNLEIQTDNDSTMVSSGDRVSDFTTIIENTFAGVHTQIPPGACWKQGYIESFNNTCEQMFYAVEDFASQKEFLKKAYTWQLTYNLIRTSQALGGKTPFQVASSHCPGVTPAFYTQLPPVIYTGAEPVPQGTDEVLKGGNLLGQKTKTYPFWDGLRKFHRGVTMEFHEITELFPLLEGGEFEQFKADIAQNGLEEPIWLYEGKVLDGRNRYRACKALGVEPAYRRYEGDDPEAFVISMNLHRRHLDRETRRQWSVKLRQAGKSYRQIAEALGIGGKTAWRDVQEATVSDDTVDLPDTVVGKDARRRPASKQQCRPAQGADADAMAVHYSSESDEWLTPGHIIDRVLKVLGEIDLDPCSNSKEDPNVPARHHFTREDDGLARPWYGRVYMNPPYGNEISDWVKHLHGQHQTGNVAEAIALVPSRTDTRWFRVLREYPRCFIWGRLKFSRHRNSAPFPSMTVYLGNNVHRFIKTFSDIGDVYTWVRGDHGSPSVQGPV